MRRFSFKPLQTLQWRLTFSYTLVTVAALLVVELLLLGALLTFVRSNYLIDQMGHALHDLFVAEARRYLQQEPPDLDGLQSWLQRAFSGRTAEEGAADSGFEVSRHIGGGQSIPWQFTFDEMQPVYILGANGQLLAQNPSSPDFVPGEQAFDFAAFPQLTEQFTAMQLGERDLSQLRYTLADDQLVNLIPLVANDGRLLGALIIIIPLPTLNAGTLGPLLTIILYSLIPLTLAAGLIGTIFGFLTARNLTRRIRTVSQAADSWSRGDFTAVAQDATHDELGQLSRRLNQMAEQLQNLLQTRQELAALEERNRLARDLHDAVKQQIFAAAMQVGAAKALLPDNPQAAVNQLNEAEELARQAQQELTALIQELRPAALHDQGLATALRHLAADWSRLNNVPVTINVQGERPLPLPVEQTLFRVVQEALANVARHSHAGQVAIHLTWQTDRVVLTITDNGRGFDPQTPGKGMGLQSMKERLESLGGRLELTSQPGQGTIVRAEL